MTATDPADFDFGSRPKRRVRLVETLVGLQREIARTRAERDFYAAQVDGVANDGEHVYLSTSCLHGEHSYCQSETGAVGVKVPAVCKFCPAGCICDCHVDERSANQ